MQPEIAEVRRWLLKARNDWTVVAKILTSEAPELDVAAFHCQQAVEKLSKHSSCSKGRRSRKFMTSVGCLIIAPDLILVLNHFAMTLNH
jgi:HEPN domain-containing protein